MARLGEHTRWRAQVSRLKTDLAAESRKSCQLQRALDNEERKNFELSLPVQESAKREQRLQRQLREEKGKLRLAMDAKVRQPSHRDC